MNNLEEEYKARFKDAESLEGIDAEQLWEQIEQQLPVSAPITAASQPPANRSGRLLLLLLLLGYCTAGHNPLKINPEDSSPSAVLVVSEQAGAPAVPDNTSLKTWQPNKPQLPKRPPYQPVPRQTITAPENATTVISPINQVPKPADLPQAIHPSDDTLLLSKQTAPEPPILPTRAYPFLAIKADTLKTFVSAPITPLVKPQPLIPEEKKWNIGWIAGLHRSALSFMGSGNQASFSETLNQTHSATTGYAFSAEIHRKINHRLYISTGLGYVYAPSTFHYVRQWDTVMYRNQNPNADLIRAKATRTVLHHNRLNYLHLPITAGFQKPFGRVILGMQAGAGLHFILLQEGKSIQKNGAIALAGADTAAYKPFFFSLNAQAFAAFRLKGSMTLRMDYSWRYQYHGASDFWGLRTATLYSGVGAGAFWAF